MVDSRHGPPDQTALRLVASTRFSRLRRTVSRELICSGFDAKQQEGGAHVDQEVHEAYSALAESNSLGWSVRDEAGTRPLSSNPVFPSVRPISHEVLAAAVVPPVAALHRHRCRRRLKTDPVSTPEF